jgi:2-polyprenyl-3-methyl-5-hydroxy-6-metoxy-1,4-benzoquinol methylase
MSNDVTLIQAHPQPTCYLCGAWGKPLYAGLTDRLYSIPGVWRLVSCSCADCGLVWLNPLPSKQDIGKAYANYFTHSTEDVQASNRTYQIWVRLGYIYHLFLRVVGIYQLRQRARRMYLDRLQPGRLLDVGCGDGHWLAEMRLEGWQVEGQELDDKAAEVARSQYNLTVHLGALADLNLPTDTYDAIVLSHVVEHVHDPIDLLNRCHRLLKRGGVLTVVTPNLKSYGHQSFRQNWVALDPPRHLYLFTSQTLSQIAARAGFKSYRTWTTPVRAQFTAIASQAIYQQGCHVLNAPYTFRQLLMATWFEWQAWFAYTSKRDTGEECILQAVK